MLFQYAAVAAADAVEKLVEWLAAAVAVVVALAFGPGVAVARFAVAWFAVAWLAVVRFAAAAAAVVVDFAGPGAAAVIGVVAEPVAEPVAELVAVDVVACAPQGSFEPSHPISSQLYQLAHQKAATYARNPEQDVEHVGCTVHFVALRAAAEYVAGACALQRLSFFAPSPFQPLSPLQPRVLVAVPAFLAVLSL